MPKSPESFPGSGLDKDKDRDRKLKMSKAGTLALSLALTAAASAGATIEANRTNQQKPIDPSEMGRSFHAGYYDTLPGERDALKLPGVEYQIVQPTDEQIKTSNVYETMKQEAIYMEWAHLFDKDPMAVEMVKGQESLEESIDVVQKLIANGFSIDRVSIKGFASDEAHIVRSDNPGFGIDNPENVALANKRAEAVTKMFLEQLGMKIGQEAADGVKNKLVIEQGEEIRDDAQAAEITALAKSLGMSAYDLVDTFNLHPDKLPVEVFDQMLGLKDDRYVLIEIEASAEIETSEDILERKSLVLIPILIPILYREGDEPEEAKPIPPVPVGRLPREDEIPDSRKNNWTRTNTPYTRGFSHPAGHRIQPRQHNFNQRNRGNQTYQTNKNNNAKIDRSKGGNRSGKR